MHILSYPGLEFCASIPYPIPKLENKQTKNTKPKTFTERACYLRSYSQLTTRKLPISTIC